jgi:lipoprotein LpqH
VNPASVLAGGGAAIVVAVLVSCSRNNSPSVSTRPGNPGIPGVAKVTVAGQPRNSQQGHAVCTKEPGRDGLATGTAGYKVKIDEAAPNEVDVELASDASAVWWVRINGFNGMVLNYVQDTTVHGNASATKDGTSYKVTGNIAQAYEEGGSRTYPFEIDFSCS